jgi:adenylosuccinate lyase
MIMESVKRGSGRETAHEAIKEHSLAAAKAIRSGTSGADLLDRLAGDRRIGLGKKVLLGILAESARFVGSAPNQVDSFVAEVKVRAKRVKGAAEYRPSRLL